MIKKIKSWKERLVGLDNPTTFAERQAAIQEASELIKYAAGLEVALLMIAEGACPGGDAAVYAQQIINEARGEK